MIDLFCFATCYTISYVISHCIISHFLNSCYVKCHVQFLFMSNRFALTIFFFKDHVIVSLSVFYPCWLFPKLSQIRKLDDWKFVSVLAFPKMQWQTQLQIRHSFEQIRSSKSDIAASRPSFSSSFFLLFFCLCLSIYYNNFFWRN